MTGQQQPQITILCARFWPDSHGGVETHVWHFTRELAKAGICVRVMTENRTQSPDRQMIEPGLTVWRHPPVDAGRLWRWLPLVRLRRWTQRLRRSVPLGTIWATDPIFAVATILAGYRDRLIYNPAGCVPAMRDIGHTHPQVTSMRVPRMIAWMDRLAYRLAPCVVVSSFNVKSQYTRYCGDHGNLHVMPLAAAPATVVDKIAARTKLEIDCNKFVIGFVGRLDPCKGLDFLFEAIDVAGRRNRIQLLIVGDGPDRDRAYRSAKQLNLLPYITWAGRMADPSSAYAAMDVLVMPSIYEAFGLAAVEAMTYRVPVLARGGNKKDILTASDEIVQHGHNGFVVDGHDPSDLGRRLAQLERTPELCCTMGKAAGQCSSTQTWGRYTQRCITELLEQPVVRQCIDQPSVVGRQAA